MHHFLCYYLSSCLYYRKGVVSYCCSNVHSFHQFVCAPHRHPRCSVHADSSGITDPRSAPEPLQELDGRATPSMAEGGKVEKAGGVQPPGVVGYTKLSNREQQLRQLCMLLICAALLQMLFALRLVWSCTAPSMPHPDIASTAKSGTR